MTDRHNVPQEGWRTMDSAPRDGTPVDLWHKDGSRLADCRYEEGRGWRHEPGPLHYLEKAVTHWHPAIAPPRPQPVTREVHLSGRFLPNRAFFTTGFPTSPDTHLLTLRWTEDGPGPWRVTGEAALMGVVL